MLYTPSPSPSTSQAPLPWRLLQIFNRSVSQKVTVHVCIADGNHGGPGKSRKFGLTVLSIFCPVLLYPAYSDFFRSKWFSACGIYAFVTMEWRYPAVLPHCWVAGVGNVPRI